MVAAEDQREEEDQDREDDEQRQAKPYRGRHDPRPPAGGRGFRGRGLLYFRQAVAHQVPGDATIQRATRDGRSPSRSRPSVCPLEVMLGSFLSRAGCATYGVPAAGPLIRRARYPVHSITLVWTACPHCRSAPPRAAGRRRVEPCPQNNQAASPTQPVVSSRFFLQKVGKTAMQGMCTRNGSSERRVWERG